MTVAHDTARVQRLQVAAFEIPTDAPGIMGQAIKGRWQELVNR